MPSHAARTEGADEPSGDTSRFNRGQRMDENDIALWNVNVEWGPHDVSLS
jgi:hypothetical protein